MPTQPTSKTVSSSNVGYYKELGLEATATDDEIKRAYRQLGLKFHPHINKEAGAQEKFYRVSEAYDVLSDGIFMNFTADIYGDEGLKAGVAQAQGMSNVAFAAGYQYHGKPEETFSQFFGSSNPFQDIFTSTIADGLYGINAADLTKSLQKQPGAQDAPVEYDLPCTLEELFKGCVKMVKVETKVLGNDGTSVPREKTLTIEVRPGWRAGTRLTFAKEGNEGPNKTPADLVFIIRQVDHHTYQRDGQNLIYTAKIPLVKALIGTEISLLALDGRKLIIPCLEVLHSDYQKVVPHEGMPNPKNNKQRGDLIIKFKVIHPTYLSEKQKKLIKQAFAES